ncbi:leucine-rich repeat receptor-like protein kinase TDR [Tanacetum coccineum]
MFKSFNIVLSYQTSATIRVAVHRDLTPKNILLDGDMEAIVAYFGVANLTHCDESMSVISGPYGYSAPGMALLD